MTNNREEQNIQNVKRKSLIVTLLNRLAYFIYSLFTETWIGRSVIGDGRLYDESAIGKLLSGENKSKEAKERRRKLGGALERNEFMRIEDDLTVKITEKLSSLGLTFTNPTEKVHLALGIVQNFAHESVFDKHDYIDYVAMKNLVIEILINLFKK